MKKEEQYYRICLRHMGKYDNCFLFWSRHGSGYNRSICKADLINDTKDSSKDDPMVSKELIDKYIKKVRLPIYGDREETYGGLNEFYVLPNTGQVRKALGITTLDIHLDGERNSFDAYFEDTEIEVFKSVKSKTSFRVKAKECVSEFWYFDDVFEAETRSQAICKAFDFWIPCGYDNYIEFKKDVSCKRESTLVLDRWRKIK